MLENKKNHKISLVDGTIFESIEGKTILESAQFSNVNLDYSCNNGRCNACKAKVIQGQTKNIKKSVIDPKEMADQQYILTCCSEPLTDISLDLHNLTIFENYKPMRKPAKISGMKFINNDLLDLELRINPREDINFLPGQYMKLRYKNIERSYSISAYDRSKKNVSFLIKRYEDGEMSRILFDGIVKIDDLIQLNGPFGTFHFNFDNNKNVIFLATGTGIAPFISILSDMNEKRAKQKVFLFWGNRTQKDFFKLPNYENLDIKFYKVLSRENIQGFKHGYIQDVMANTISDLENYVFYACGSNQMVEDAEKKLNSYLNQPVFYKDIFVES